MKNFIKAIIILSGILTTPINAQTIDNFSYANAEDISIDHLYLDLMVNFDDKKLKGFAELSLNWHNPKTQTLILDTRGLVIKSVMLETVTGQWQATKFKLSPHDEVLGSELSINLVSKAQRVRIYYYTKPSASGLQWLLPEQTAGKKHPFVYSQNQPVHARSWIPIQDTPSVRMTYQARIHTPKQLRAVMSANNKPEAHRDGDYLFSMPQAIPAYLIALAVGDLSFSAMSDITGVYAEPSILDAAVAEFNDTQAMIDVTEKLFGQYRWGRYDLLILPPSFPYGGMENPRLSFITPTVIAGDKSLVNLIAHELAHSWSGNLVTNESWRDLWLNEGFTSYVENRIMEEVFGIERAIMEQSLAVQSLGYEMAELPPEDTELYLDLKGRAPDHAFTSIPYIKGQLFLMYLEDKFGRENFDIFIKQYFAQYAFKSLGTKAFEQYLNEHLISKYPEIVSKNDIDEWLYEQGLPADSPKPSANAFNEIDIQIFKLFSEQLNVGELNTSQWTIHEWLYFINNLPQDISLDWMEKIDTRFQLTQSGNAEVAHAWFLLALNVNYNKVLPAIEQYLITIGRRKLIVPLYKVLIQTSEGRIWAKRVYQKARVGYHILATGTIDKLFNEN